MALMALQIRLTVVTNERPKYLESLWPAGCDEVERRQGFSPTHRHWNTAPASYRDPSQIKGQPTSLMVPSVSIPGRATAYAHLSSATSDRT